MSLLSLGRDERGFTMVTVIITMMIVMLLSVAALSAAQNDLPASKHDTDRKIAYAAAEAGVQNYLYHLVEDPTYWSKCTTVSAPVNDRWNGTATRRWATVPGARARYTVELLPANGSTACDPLQPESTMIDTSRGTFRIRVTGQALNLDGATGVKRTIVVTSGARACSTTSTSPTRRSSTGASTRSTRPANRPTGWPVPPASP